MKFRLCNTSAYRNLMGAATPRHFSASLTNLGSQRVTSYSKEAYIHSLFNVLSFSSPFSYLLDADEVSAIEGAIDHIREYTNCVDFKKKDSTDDSWIKFMKPPNKKEG